MLSRKKCIYLESQAGMAFGHLNLKVYSWHNFLPLCFFFTTVMESAGSLWNISTLYGADRDTRHISLLCCHFHFSSLSQTPFDFVIWITSGDFTWKHICCWDSEEKKTQRETHLYTTIQRKYPLWFSIIFPLLKFTSNEMHFFLHLSWICGFSRGLF